MAYRCCSGGTASIILPLIHSEWSNESLRLSQAKSMSEHLIANPRPSSHSEHTRNESNSKLLHWGVQQWSSLRDFPLLDLSSDPKSCRESFAWPGASAPGIWQTATRYARRERFDLSVQASGNVFHSCTTFFVWNCVRKQKAKQNIDITWTHLWCNTNTNCINWDQNDELKIKLAKVPASNVFMRPDMTTPVPEFPVFVWACKTRAFSCHVASLENWKVSHMQRASNILNWKKHWKMFTRMQTFPARKSLTMKRRRVRRLTSWICQVRSFCWTALAEIELPILQMYIVSSKTCKSVL